MASYETPQSVELRELENSCDAFSTGIRGTTEIDMTKREGYHTTKHEWASHDSTLYKNCIKSIHTLYIFETGTVLL